MRMPAIVGLLIVLLLVFMTGRATPTSSLKTNLVAYWSLEEINGTRHDSTGHGHSLTDNGNVARAIGQINYAALFDGANYLATSSTDVSVGEGDFTVAAWVRLDALNENPALVCKLSSEDDIEFSLQVSDYNGFSFTVGDSSAQTSSVSWGAGVPSLDVWYFVVAWYDASAGEIRIQVNNGGVNVASHSGGVLQGSSPIILGYYPAEGFYLQGAVDAAGIWSRKLTNTERNNLWNSGNGLQWPF